MKDNSIDIIIENLFLSLPIIHKKLLGTDFPDSPRYARLYRHHVAVMGILSVNTLSISEIARRLMVPKPQMTRLINQLMDADIVARQPDAHDRRVMNIVLTGNGRAILEEYRALLAKNMKKKLSCLSDKEIEELSFSLVKLKEIGSRLG